MYEAELEITGTLHEVPITVHMQGKGSYDQKHEDQLQLTIDPECWEKPSFSTGDNKLSFPVYMVTMYFGIFFMRTLSCYPVWKGLNFSARFLNTLWN